MYNPSVTERFHRRVRDFWVPCAVFSVGAAVSLLVWGLLIADRRTELKENAQEVASEIGDSTAAGLATLDHVLQGLAGRWALFGRRPIGEWSAEAELEIQTHDGLTALGWADLEQPGWRVTATPGTTTETLGISERRARLHTNQPSLDPTDVDHAREPSYRVYFPMRRSDGAGGVLAAEFRLEALLESLLRGRAWGYAVEFSWGDTPIFKRGVPSTDSWQSWWFARSVVRLPYDGGEWRVLLRPTGPLAARMLNPLPHYLLVAGLGLSLLIAVLIHQWRLKSHQAHFLAASNRALIGKGEELKQLADELEARVASRTEALQEAVSELEAFNYSVSHDLRSPLGAIANFATILQEDFRDELGGDGIAVIERIRGSALQATTLLEDLLQLSHAGRSAIQFERVNVTALARECFAQAIATEKGADVECIIERLPSVDGDRTLLGQVFANLFSNALKYSRGQEKRNIWVSGRTDEKTVIFEVRDNGRGFDTRFASKLFEIFERLHNDPEIEGTGVGLALVARIVKRHGGSVWAESKPGEGSRFYVSLPREGTT